MTTSRTEGLVDLHCHVLPGIDDGPEDGPAAVELVQGLERIGFMDFYPTPHQKHGAWAPDAPAREQAANTLRALLEETGSRARIHPPAGENMWDQLFLERREDASFPCFPGEKAFLVEFQPDAIPPRLEKELFQQRIAGRLPVVAHVERYPALTGDLERLARVGQSAALLVNLGTLGGGQGFWARRASRKLVRRGLIHAVATDSHGAADLPPCQAGLDWIRGAMGAEGVQRLLADGPRRILAGELPEW
jgi:protein-tyrosine phosphatase